MNKPRNKQLINSMYGILLVILISVIATLIAEIGFVKSLSLSPLIVGIIIGMIYANSARTLVPAAWTSGVIFCSKRILRLAIILYGFRLTFQSVMEVGASAIVIDILVICITLALGMFVGRLLKIDTDLALLTSTGSAICGAAAVLGAEPIVKAQPHKTAVAVSTVVIFGTLSMFLYPIMYRSGLFDMTDNQWGIYTGATIHEVAHAVGAGNAMGASANTAIIVKMIRVIFLAPVLVIMAFVLKKIKLNSVEGETSSTKIAIPWFAFGFIVVIGINSLISSYSLISASIIDNINTLDTFLLTMAMTALGMETNFSKFKQAGIKPFVLALVLFVWLVVGGYILVKLLTPLFA